MPRCTGRRLQAANVPRETPLDVYGSEVAPVGTSAPVPDDAFTNNDVLTSYDSYDTPVIDLTNSEDLANSIDDVVFLKDASEAQGADDSNLLPPIDQDDIDAFEDALAESATPTSAPVLFTYAPSEGATVDDLSPQVNIVVPDAGGSASDPLNVIPDEYEEYEDFGIEDSYQENYVDNNYD